MEDGKINRARLYTAQIFTYFSMRFGKVPLMTLDDWICVRQWQEDGIPVEYVFNGIDRAFSHKPNDVTSLRHCTSAVIELCS